MHEQLRNTLTCSIGTLHERADVFPGPQPIPTEPVHQWRKTTCSPHRTNYFNPAPHYQDANTFKESQPPYHRLVLRVNNEKKTQALFQNIQVQACASNVQLSDRNKTRSRLRYFTIKTHVLSFKTNSIFLPSGGFKN
ncbi:hypothetical protein NPIL_40531 [Nephila pilipes]|uniref:Uncharacterized protein n=1 Tax=Nephila pilipes TaxID=299642 RepID=A0A8X6Q5E3_NEPPI|nr:hypothetical protein NPIL_40531 [Nephila pilipes]